MILFKLQSPPPPASSSLTNFLDLFWWRDPAVLASLTGDQLHVPYPYGGPHTGVPQARVDVVPFVGVEGVDVVQKLRAATWLLPCQTPPLVVPVQLGTVGEPPGCPFHQRRVPVGHVEQFLGGAQKEKIDYFYTLK